MVFFNLNDSMDLSGDHWAVSKSDYLDPDPDSAPALQTDFAA